MKVIVEDTVKGHKTRDSQFDLIIRAEAEVGEGIASVAVEDMKSWVTDFIHDFVDEEHTGAPEIRIE